MWWLKGRRFFPDIFGTIIYQAVHAILALRINGFITEDFIASGLLAGIRLGGHKNCFQKTDERKNKITIFTPNLVV